MSNTRTKKFSGFYDSELKTILELFEDTNNPQAEYFKWQLSQCKKVKIEPLDEVLPVELFNMIKLDRIHKKGCYQAAYSLVDNLHSDDLKYVEGFGLLHGISIQHAWVKYKDKYFDPIAFFIFNEKNMILEEYNSIIELDVYQLYEIVTKTKVYGPNIAKYYEMNVLKK